MARSQQFIYTTTPYYFYLSHMPLLSTKLPPLAISVAMRISFVSAVTSAIQRCPAPGSASSVSTATPARSYAAARPAERHQCGTDSDLKKVSPGYSPSVSLSKEVTCMLS